MLVSNTLKDEPPRTAARGGSDETTDAEQSGLSSPPRMVSLRTRRAHRAGAPGEARPAHIGGIAAGDDDAELHELYVRYADSVYGYVASIIRDEHEAQDVVQQVFMKLPRALARYEDRGVPFSAWILRIARNAALDHIRQRRMIPCEEVRASDTSFDDTGRDRLHSLKQALVEIPHEQREVMVLRHVIGLSPGEIAERLGKSEGSIHGLHHRGRRAVRRTLRELDSAPAVAV